MRKKIFAAIVLTAALLPVAHAQRANTFYVDQFQGDTVGQKATKAQAQCLPDTNITCVLIFDPVLSAYGVGNMPTRCGNCTWLDFRSPGSIGGGLSPLFLTDPWFDVRLYGALCNGSDDTAAIQAAITAAIAIHGGSVYIPNGKTCTVAGQLVFDNSVNVGLLCGQGQSLQFGGSPAAQLTFTGTGAGSLISARSTNGFFIAGCALVYTSSSFTGTFIDTSHGSNNTDSANVHLQNLMIESNNSTRVTASVLVSFDKTINSFIDNCQMHNAAVAIRGAASSASYSVNNTVTHCQFSAGTPNGDISTVMIQNPDQSWTIGAGNDFEMGQGAGNVSVVNFTSSVVFKQLTIQSIWAGDSGGAGAPSLINIPANSHGVTIQGSQLAAAAQSNSFGVTVFGPSDGIVIFGNVCNAVTACVNLGSSVQLYYFGNSSIGGAGKVSGVPTGGFASDFTGTVGGATWFFGGIGIDGSGIKNQNVATGSISAGVCANVTLTWSTAFPDVNYNAYAAILDSTSAAKGLTVDHIQAINAASVVVTVCNGSAGALNQSLRVLAVHYN